MLHVVTIRCNLLKESVKELFVRPLIISTGDQLQFLTVISTFEVAHSVDRIGQDRRRCTAACAEEELLHIDSALTSETQSY